MSSVKMAAPTKEYGLFVRSSSKSTVQPKLAIFEDDSDEDGRGAVGKSLQKEANRIQAKKQLKINLETAMAEDPSVFKYDEIYDDITQKKQEQTGWQKRNREKNPKYIESLMKAAKSRKLDQERALERKVQKEREAEGEEFAGKEAFVTSAYKKKMQEMEELEEKERREAQIEALTDVTKQKDLSGFYRQLYKHTLGTDEPQPPKESSSETAQDKASPEKGDSSQDESGSRSKVGRDERKPRQFRRRRHTTDSSSEDEEIGRPSKMVRQASTSPDSDSSLEKDRDKNVKMQGRKRESSSSDSSSKKVFALENIRRRRSSRSSPSHDRSPTRSKYPGSSRSRNDTSDRYKHTSSSSRRRSHERSKSDSSESSKRRNRPKKSGDGSAERRHGHSGSERSHRSREETSDRKSKAEIDKDKRDRSTGDKKSEISASTEEARREKLVALFTKRHVGGAFEQARERYLARKQARLAAIVAC